MRVLHVNKFVYRRGGAEGYMLDVAELQMRAGHEVAFFGMEHELNIDSRYAAHFPGYLDYGATSANLPTRVRLAARMLYSSSARRGIDEVVADFRPDLVHLHNIYHQLSPSILRPLAKRGIPSVMTLHDYKLACPTYRFLANGEICEACLGGQFSQAVRKRCNRGSLSASALNAAESAIHARFGAYGPVDVFLCPSRFMLEQMTRAGVYPSRMRHNPNFVHTDQIAPKAHPGGTIMFAGRLSPEKGVDVLIEAAGLLGVPVAIAGDGPEMPRLRELAAERGVEARFFGRVPADRLHELMRDALVTVLPARWYENQPLGILESFACGVPVVASGIGGIPELVTAGHTGDLVPPNDSEALAAALETYVGDEALAYTRGEAARRTVEERHSPEVHLRRLSELYDEAAEHRARRTQFASP